MLKETHKKFTSLKLEHAPATKSTAGYNYYLSPRTTPSSVKQRLANKQHRRSPKESKVKPQHNQ